MEKLTDVLKKKENVEVLLRKLSKRKSSDTVYNPYKDKDVLNNLREYFSYLIRNNPSILLIGESPGYDGCRWTGIPFTSGFVVRNSNHKMFGEIGNRIVLKKVVKEPTGTIMWEFLGEDRPVPILWNSFPFHPHDKGNPESNRQPSTSEVLEGLEYLTMVYENFKPKTLGSLGRVGERLLRKTFPNEEVVYIRHPSRGGKNEFIKGMTRF